MDYADITVDYILINPLFETVGLSGYKLSLLRTTFPLLVPLRCIVMSLLLMNATFRSVKQLS